MRPLSFKRIIEVCSLALNDDNISFEIISDHLSLTPRRGKEILRELTSMNLLSKTNDSYIPTNGTRKIVDYFVKGDWNNIHDYFRMNNPFYREMMFFMTTKGMNDSYILKGLLQNFMDHELDFNQTILDVLMRWGERFGVLQRHLYKKTFYAIKDTKPDNSIFVSSLKKHYNKLNVKKGLFLSQTFVEIPKLREDVCENLKMRREIFDCLFMDYYLSALGTVELAGAPTITTAKRSPLNIRKTNIEINGTFVSPVFDLEKERRGITIKGKNYFYLAIYS